MLSVETERATVKDLQREPGKAELIGGRIVRYMPTGYWPGFIAGNIYTLLRAFAKATQCGVALGDNVGFVVPELTSGRESFSPDVSFLLNPPQKNPMAFVQGAPEFAVEIRSEGDYGPAAEMEMAAKRTDYFEAGTQVVWDVDSVAECVHVYTHLSPETKKSYDRGQIADAEPALPGWRVSVDEIFEM